MSLVKQLAHKQLLNVPSFLPESTQYECIMGSFAYGVDSDSSDIDLYGFCIPDKTVVFPHLNGEILGFGSQKKKFEQYSEHHIFDQSAGGGKGKEYDITIYNIVKYFQLVMENNPNMIDSLFVPLNCIVYSTPVGQLVRENRKIFLHKGSWFKFKGYSYAQLAKMRTKNPESGKRRESVDKFGFDVKFAFHIVRLLNECEQLLTEGDLDLQRNREQLKSIRRGEWTMKEIEDYFIEKEKSLELLYQNSKLPHSPDEEKIKQLLFNCLEQHFGTLKDCVTIIDPAVRALREISETIDKARLKGVI